MVTKEKQFKVGIIAIKIAFKPTIEYFPFEVIPNSFQLLIITTNSKN